MGRKVKSGKTAKYTVEKTESDRDNGTTTTSSDNSHLCINL